MGSEMCIRDRTVHIAIDNLLKGAASQAIQCLNLMSGVSEDSGLNLL